MKSYSEKELQRALFATGISTGSLVMVHSSLFSLGRIENQSIQSIPECHYRAIRSMIGPEGTIVVPTFNFGFCRGEPFDRQRTPSRGMGSLSEYLRQRDTARRSLHPTQSFAAEGPLAEDLTERDTLGAFETQSGFDRLIELDAEILLIGCGIEPISLVHWAEERIGVPYRYWKDFQGIYRDRQRESLRRYRMYVRDLHLDPTVRLAPIERQLIRRDLLRCVPLSSSTIESCRARDFAHQATALLRRDRSALISEPTPDQSRSPS